MQPSEQHAEQSLYFQDLEARAKILGITPDEVRAGDLESLRKPIYPKKDCLTTAEFILAEQGSLIDERIRHARTCFFCRVILEKNCGVHLDDIES